METTLDRFGRVVIPKRVRDDLGLVPGVSVEQRGHSVSLSPLREEETLADEDGVLVFRGHAAGDLRAAVEGAREDRLNALTPGSLR